MQNFTQKSIESLNLASNIAKENGNQQINSLHLLKGLLSDENGLINNMLTKMGNFQKYQAEIVSIYQVTYHKFYQLPKNKQRI